MKIKNVFIYMLASLVTPLCCAIWTILESGVDRGYADFGMYLVSGMNSAAFIYLFVLFFKSLKRGWGFKNKQDYVLFLAAINNLVVALSFSIAIVLFYVVNYDVAIVSCIVGSYLTVLQLALLIITIIF